MTNASTMDIQAATPQEHDPANPWTPENPFFAESSLPFAAPPFDRIADAHFRPALLAGLAEEAAEIRAIADNPEPPTFANTLEAVERSGRLLDRVSAVLGCLSGACTNPTLEELQTEMAPRFAEHADAINLNPALFARIDTLFTTRATLKLPPEALRLLEITHERFISAGAQLSPEQKQHLMDLNREESTLIDAFSRKLLAASKAAAFHTTDPQALAGLTDSQLAAARTAAEARGQTGYLLPLQNTTQQPLLHQLTDPATRKALFDLSCTRTERSDENDTRATVTRLAQLRAKKAALLGFPTYAAWKLKSQMAKIPEATLAFLESLTPAALAEANAEEQAIHALLAQQGHSAAVLQPSDRAFYSEQLRQANSHLDDAELRPYLELNRVLHEGVFHAATALFGITFHPRPDLPTYAPEVEVFEILDHDGAHLALFFCDWAKRDNKRGGAWMGSFRPQSHLLGHTPLIYNVANFTQPAPGEPVLLSFDEVLTLFHEFGHALHGLFTECTFPSLSGTRVPRDFVEFPSQFNEHWATEPTVFARYARHWQTGAPMPEELAQTLRQTAHQRQGYRKLEVLAAATLDMAWHTLPADAPPQDPTHFEREALDRKGLLIPSVPPRYRSTFFSHSMGGGYSAGYYAYLWAEMLEDSAVTWFAENGGLTRPNGDRLRRMVLSRGNTEDLAPMFDRWLGNEPGKTQL